MQGRVPASCRLAFMCEGALLPVVHKLLAARHHLESKHREHVVVSLFLAFTLAYLLALCPCRRARAFADLQPIHSVYHGVFAGRPQARHALHPPVAKSRVPHAHGIMRRPHACRCVLASRHAPVQHTIVPAHGALDAWRALPVVPVHLRASRRLV